MCVFGVMYTQNQIYLAAPDVRSKKKKKLSSTNCSFGSFQIFCELGIFSVV